MGLMKLLEKLFQKKEANPNYEDSFKSFEPAREIPKDICLLVIADPHGDFTLNQNLKYELENREYDLCCVLGDVKDSDVKIILEYIPKEKIVALLGNHDRFNVLENFGLMDLNGKVVEVNGVKIGGIQGSFKYKNEEFPSFTHEESIDFLNQMPPVDILLSHDKPFTIDYHQPSHDGLKGITHYLYKNRVPMNIHGHIHTSYLDKLKNGTIVKGVYEVEMVEVNAGRIQII